MSKDFKFIPLPGEGFIRLTAILSTIPVSRTQLWRMIKSGEFPAPKKIGARINVWDVTDLRKYMDKISQGELDE